MITQDLLEAARNNGDKGPILGNSQLFWSDSSSGGAGAASQQAHQNGGGGHQSPQPANDFDDDIPFGI